PTSSKHMYIRPATPEDAPAFARIFNQYLAKATMVLTPRTAVDYQVLLTNERCTAFTATNDEGTIVGFASAKPYSDRKGYALAGEVSIFLDTLAVGKGAGTQLYDSLIPAADELGYRHLTAKIWANNSGSIRFHKRFSFRMVGTQVGIGWVGGKRVDTVIMERVW
ncbi:MAG: N-acetyltransferase family protein, partial [Bacteroidota bacterium]